MMSESVLSVKDLQKAFNGKTVVKGLTFDLRGGEILALVGENGAGKSTSKNMLCGLLKPTKGDIFVAGKKVEQVKGSEHGISAVHQELSLFKSLTVAENLCINELPGHSCKVNWQQAQQIARQQLDFLGVHIDPQALLSTLGAGKQQIVEIAKALLHADKVLILDEPTTSLTKPEREKLFAVMQKLKARGVAMIFISHFMDEVYQMADKYVVLRDGLQVDTGYLLDTPRAELEAKMVGREMANSQIQLADPQAQVSLTVKNFTSCDFNNISLSLHKGEILGIGGLMGAGRTELAEAISGIRPASGKIYINGQYIEKPTLDKMLKLKLCYITEDRRGLGLFPQRSVKENTTAANISHFVKRIIKGVGFKGEQKSAQKTVEKMNVVLPHIDSAVSHLSGGNQQKVLLGRWLACEPNILILDEPTKGVDIGAKLDIHKQISALAAKGVAVLLVSSDLQELLDLSHRIMVMRTGEQVAEFTRENFNPTQIIAAAASSVHDKEAC
ncbi:sugar ABC transporter ATP-binding protein [Catenovulum adriaticum]|uniref:Autoinducer 2 import ATP-binding protein LsrA n=1 Tax=Catenovulum adriaticum TaxID=2984846 RepID=A0ABY7ARY2_9ALTE|nr:sugar ABC transporter ATP-binding protein [Catenovulum sp. TS8]WAJ72032.1 sugar ABC transporter ATP-binding protein [Catenovulum sp. TS8]